MIRLLIADDEPLVCVGLQSMLNWGDYGIEIAGTARNGQQAAEMIETLRPEIVITDIKMPLKTGLELAGECSRKYGKIPLFIILTSYEEFDFVRKALVFQAVDYLVKLELNQEALSASVKRALSMLEELRKTDDGAAGKSQGQIRELRDNFYFRLVNKLFESLEQFEALKEELEIVFHGSAFTVLTAEINTVLAAELAIRDSPQVYQSTNYSERPGALYVSTTQMVREKLEKLFSCNMVILDTRHFIIVFCLEDLSTQRKLLEKELRKTIEMVHNYFNVRIRMALGCPVEDPFRLDESYLTARQAFEETSYDEPLRIFERHGFQQQLIAGVREYIKQNLDTRLSLPEVADHFNLSPNYLSRLFTKFTGGSFVEYVTAEKITAAKSMLIRGEGPIYEIAEKLKFESAFYFSKVFKKVEGVSPREFLHSLEGSADYSGESAG
jgi:two-component system response regulator YesN